MNWGSVRKQYVPALVGVPRWNLDPSPVGELDPERARARGAKARHVAMKNSNCSTNAVEGLGRQRDDDTVDGRVERTPDDDEGAVVQRKTEPEVDLHLIDSSPVAEQ